MSVKCYALESRAGENQFAGEIDRVRSHIAEGDFEAPVALGCVLQSGSIVIVREAEAEAAKLDACSCHDGVAVAVEYTNEY